MCPYCGHSLPHPIIHGISSCNNCDRIFESSTYHRILSASWLVRRHHITDQDTLIQQYNYEPWLADLVIDFVAEGCCSHEEFQGVLKELEFCETSCEGDVCAACQNSIDLAS
jgi:hypothetical protein